MAVRFLIYVGLTWVSFACSSQAGPPGDDPLRSKVSTTQCSRNEDCQENFYCGGRSKNRCIECINCSEHLRLPKVGYDGQFCATHDSDCGPCKEGYEELGGVCKPREDSIPAIRPISGLEDNVSYRNDQREEKGQEASYSWVVASILVVSMLLVLGLMIVAKIYYHKAGTGNRNEEEAGLTSYNGPCEPTAPPATIEPEEYKGQAEYNPFVHGLQSNALKGGRVILPKRVHQTPSTALPFNEGNGAGDWVVINDASNADIPDTVDGAAASTSVVQPQQEPNNNNRNPVHGNATENSIAAYGEMNPINNPPSQERLQQHQAMALSHQSQNPNLTGGLQQNQLPQGGVQIDPDPVVFQMQVYVRAQMRVPPNQPPANGPPEHGTRLVVSAPTSPRRIDDTHAHDLLQLTDDFVSDISLDSGTGTNEHDRSVPSRSASGGFSDIEMESLYDN